MAIEITETLRSDDLTVMEIILRYMGMARLMRALYHTLPIVTRGTLCGPQQAQIERMAERMSVYPQPAFYTDADVDYMAAILKKVRKEEWESKKAEGDEPAKFESTWGDLTRAAESTIGGSGPAPESTITGRLRDAAQMLREQRMNPVRPRNNVVVQAAQAYIDPDPLYEDE